MTTEGYEALEEVLLVNRDGFIKAVTVTKDAPDYHFPAATSVVTYGDTGRKTGYGQRIFEWTREQVSR